MLRKCLFVLVVTLCCYSSSYSQDELKNTTEAGITVGPMVFLGDLGGHVGKGTRFIKDYNMNTTKLAVGAYFTAYPAPWLGFRFSLNYGSIEGADNTIKPKGGDEVKWHQDISFWPHTNYSPCTAGTYVYDCTADQGPLGVLPASHNGPVVNQYNDKDEWVGCLRPEDVAKIDTSNVVYLEGPAGSVTIHNCRTLHHSKANWSEIPRPLLLNVYSAADAMPYTYNPLPSKYFGAIVRGKPARWAYHDPRPCLLPPDWSGGYTSIFAVQQEENWEQKTGRKAAAAVM